MTLSVIVPAYNEAPTIAEALRRVVAVDLDLDIIVVNDCSTDATTAEIESVDIPGIRVINHRENRGKGAAVRSGLREARGDVLVIHDGDLEYNPQDFLAMIQPILRGEARVVYGYRPLGSQSRLYRLGNRFLTLLTNLLYGASVRDMETCHKMWRREVLEDVVLTADSFDLEVELTARFLKSGERIAQLPISYEARSAKKLRWWVDGPAAVRALLRYRFRR
ncbi:MAG: glycosyltransferase family 2 protein [Chloroflexi bacterium]|nr:glycosyltransferase family 2 protein [Chloroflexota bacterium]